MCKVLNKINKRNGETLAEALVSVLVIAIGLLLLSSLIMASTRMVEKSNNRMKDIYEGTAAMEEKTAPIAGTKRLTLEYNGASKTKIDMNITIYQDEKSSLMSYQLAEQAQS